MSLSRPSDIVLLHGAFRGPWAWERVVARLQAEGHRCFTPDLTQPEATLDSYIETIVKPFTVDTMDGLGSADDAVLVGHSQGGFMARAASERLGGRLRQLVYFDAPVPKHGQTAFDFRPAGTPAPAVQRGDVIDPRPVAAGIGLSGDDADWINARLVGQPVSPSMEAVVLTSPDALALDETYVFFDQTPPGYPCAITRAELDADGRPYVTIDAPHDGIVTHPAQVAAAIKTATQSL